MIEFSVYLFAHTTLMVHRRLSAQRRDIEWLFPLMNNRDIEWLFPLMKNRGVGGLGKICTVRTLHISICSHLCQGSTQCVSKVSNRYQPQLGSFNLKI